MLEGNAIRTPPALAIDTFDTSMLTFILLLILSVFLSQQ
jgi:hypothetical protein